MRQGLLGAFIFWINSKHALQTISAFFRCVYDRRQPHPGRLAVRSLFDDFFKNMAGDPFVAALSRLNRGSYLVLNIITCQGSLS